MKEIVIVSKGNNAVAYGAGVEIKKSSTTGVSANLAVLNELLKTHVPTEAGETFRIFLMDLVQGINSGYAIDYVKTGKQLDGKELASEDLAGYKEFYELYKDRLLNVRFNQVSYIPKMKDNKAYMDLRSKAYAILNTMPTTASVQQTITQIIDPDKELRETMTALMNEALKKGDMEQYRTLKAERDVLKAPEVVTITANGISTPSEKPKFEVSGGQNIDDIDLDKELSNLNNDASTDENNDEPIAFDIEQTSNKPSWDGVQAEA